MKKMLILFGLVMTVLTVCSVAFADPALAEPISWNWLIGSGGMALIVNGSTLTGIFTNIKTTFNKVFNATPGVWQKIGMKIPSGSAQNDYAWLENFPKMRRWVGEKVIKSLKAGKYVLINEDFEATISVKRNDIEDDNLGFVGVQANGAGFSAKQWPDELIMEVANGAFDTECYDGQYFVDTDHPVVNPETGEEESVSNKGTAVLSITTLAAAQGSFGAARIAMGKFKDNEGRPLAITPNVLLVPVDLGDTARALMTNDRLEDGKPNPYKGVAEVVEDARLTSATAWFLLDTTKPVKPFIFQERKSPVFVSQTDMNSDDVFKRGEFNFGCEARGAAGYGFWQLCYGSTGLG